MPSTHRAGNIYDTQGIAPTIMENHGKVITIAEPRYGSSRLNSLIAKGKVDPTKDQFLDCYNQATYEDVAPMITSRIDGSNHYFISEPIVKLVGNIRCKVTHGGYGGDIFDEDGISRCIAATSGGASQTYVLRHNINMEPKILRMERTEEEKQRRRLEGDKGAKYSGAKQLTPRTDDISNTLTSCQKDNLLSEPQTCATRTRSYAGLPERLEVGGTEANSITTAQKDSMVIQNAPQIIGYSRDEKGKVVSHHLKDDANTLNCGGGTHYRIRKLTPRECFRLMDVDDADIDKIQSAGISKTQQYKMAGNSIVVSCLYHLFRKMFVDTETTQPQHLSLFGDINSKH